MSEATERVVVGTCLGLEEMKNGWYTVKIGVPGKQYPVKAQTKLENLLNEARRIRDEGLVATWTIKDQLQFNEDGSPKMNPNSGKQYENHYLNGVEEGATAAPPGQTQMSSTAGGRANETAAPQPEPHHAPIHFADKDRAISRMSCLSTAAMIVAADLRAGKEHEDSGLEVMKLASRYERWVYRDIDDLPSKPARQPDPPPEPEADSRDSENQTPDDDIPF